MDVAMQYDPLDRLTNAVDITGTTRFSYTAAGQLLSEDGPWASDTISYSYTGWDVGIGAGVGLPVTPQYGRSWTEPIKINDAPYKKCP